VLEKQVGPLREQSAKAKGIGTRISYAHEGKEAEPFDTPGAEKRIELNGMKSELVINREG